MICRTIIAALTLCAALIATAGVGASPLESPAAPSSFYGDVIGPFAWTDNSDNEDGFRVYIQRPELAPRLAAEFAANTTSGSVQYTFLENCSSAIWVVAYNTNGESLPSNIVHLPPPPGNCPATVQEAYTNSGEAPAHTLSITQIHAVQAVRLVENAAGCDSPQIASTDGVTVIWPNPCVDPGDTVTLEFDLLSPITIGVASWTYAPAATASADPSPNPTPAATPATLPNAGGSPHRSSSMSLTIGLALMTAGVLLLVTGGIAHRERT